MAKDITIDGQNYTGKIAIKIPLTDGTGYASFVDASAVTAVAGDVAVGKIIVDADGQEITGTATGGSSGGSGTDLANVDVYVPDFINSDELSISAGALDKYTRTVVS